MGTIANPLQTKTENHDFGKAVAALAVLSGNSEVQTAIQVTIFLASLAGPHAGLVTLGGEVQPIGSSLISVGGASPSQVKLTELLFGPLRFLQDDLIEQSRRVPPDLLNRLSTTLADPHHTASGHQHPVDDDLLAEAERQHVVGRAGKSAQVVSESHPLDRFAGFQREQAMTKDEQYTGAMFAASSSIAKVDYETVLSYNEARCLREPLVLLENPQAQVLLRGMNQVDRQSPLVLDTDGNLLSGTFGKPRHKAAEVIEGLLSGRTTQSVSGGVASQTRGVLITNLSRERFAELIGDSKFSSYLSRTLIMDPEHENEDESGSFNAEAIQLGYEQYRNAVKGVLRLRRLDAPGVAPILGQEAAELFFHAQREFHSQIEEVETRLKPYAANFIHLPSTVLWSLEHLCPQRSHIELIPTAIHLSEVAIRTHIELVREGLEAGERQKLEDEGRIMLRKLLRHEPCRFRELYRKYPDQDVSLHRPVFEHLIETQRVQEVEKGIFRVTEQGRRQLEVVGVN